jgi:hypothetical protein
MRRDGLLPLAGEPGMIAVPVGALADPAFPSPTVSVWEDRRHRWVALPPSSELHYD